VRNLPAPAQKQIAVQTANVLVAVDVVQKATAVALMASVMRNAIAGSSDQQ